MNYSIILALVVLLVSRSVIGDGEPEDRMGEERTMPDVFGFISRLFRFRNLVEDKMNSGSLNKEELKVALKDALKKSTECFSQQMANFNTTVMKVIVSFQKAITGETTSETGVGTAGAPANMDYSNPLVLVQQLAKVFTNYMNIWKDPEMQAALKDIRGKLEDAAVFSKDCLVKDLKEHISQEQATLIEELWKQSQ